MIDVNQDGTISYEELAGFMEKKQIKKLMESLDLDKDGSISISELSVAFIDFNEISEDQLR